MIPRLIRYTFTPPPKADGWTIKQNDGLVSNKNLGFFQGSMFRFVVSFRRECISTIVMKEKVSHLKCFEVL